VILFINCLIHREVVLQGISRNKIIEGIRQYFSLPHRFLQESGHSCGIRWNPEEWTGIHLNGTGIHRNDCIPAGMGYRNDCIPAGMEYL
jgi:hypothetical protein